MGLRMSFSNLGGNILLVAAFVTMFIAPVLTSIAEVVLIVLKLLGYIDWSWPVVILSPILVELIPLAFWGDRIDSNDVTSESSGTCKEEFLTYNRK